MRKTSTVRVAALAVGLGLMAGVPALAADDGRWRDHGDQQPAANQAQDQNQKGQKPDQHRDRGEHKGDKTPTPAPAPSSSMHRTDWQNNNQNNNNNDNDRDRKRDDNKRYDNNNNNNNNNGNWNGNNGRNNTDYRNNNNRFDNNRGDNRRSHFNWTQYQKNFKSPRRYHINVYVKPQGFYYRRWSYGQRLPIAFYARNYWLMDYIAYGLFAPPPGTVWVRYGDDALLIDTDTGEIIQVRYDVFYS